MSDDRQSTDADRGAVRNGDRNRKRGFDPAGRLSALEERDLRRELSPVDRVDDRVRFASGVPVPADGPPTFDDEESLVFASNSYLGLTNDRRVREAAKAAVETVGTGAGASRLVTGDTLVHRQLERELADTKGTERALAFSSGYAANVGTIAALDPDVILSDEYNHASIIDACRLADAEVVVYDHCDAAALERALAEREREYDIEADDERWLIVTDSVFSMDGTVAPLASICGTAERYGAWVMVDEAHATGLYADGGGIVQREGLGDRVQVQMGTLSKALASQGGYVAGSEELIGLLINAARSFVFSTGLAPPAAAAAGEALSLARDDDRRERLWDNVARLRDGLEAMGYDVWGSTQILPVVVGDRVDALALADALRDRGVIAPAIRPPTVPEGTSRIRVAPTATHTVSEIDRCLDAFRAAGDEVGLP